MTADRNFTVKLTLKEATLVRETLQARFDELRKIPARDLTKEQRETLPALDKMLRIDF